MRNLSWRNMRSTIRIVAPLAAVAILAVACASSGNSNSAGSNGGSNSSVSIMTKNGPNGTYLTDGSGKTLYVFASDTGNSSTCSGACAAAWPPLTVSGSAKAGSGVMGGDLGTTKRSDGKTQVTYAGHPLYYYAGDSSAGQMNGQGINQFGGVWWVVDANGKAITSAGAPSGSSGSGSGGTWS